jgi:branched-chain amino acid transport system permease protein
VQTVIQNVVDAIALGSLYALFALGIALIFGIMRLVNFAHGELVMVGGYVLVLFADLPLAWRVLLMIAIVVVFALAMEVAAFRPIRGASPLTLLVTSFALSFLLQNLAILILGARPKSANVSTFLTESVEVGSISIPILNIVTVATTAILLGGLALFLTRTRLGVQMRASAEDFRMARLLGVRANVVIATAFAISGGLAAVAALLLVAQTGTVGPRIGVNVVVVAFIATILGGTGSLSGAVAAGFLLGGLAVAFQATLPLELRPYRDAFMFAVVIVLLLVRPGGLVVLKSATARV